MWENSCNGDRQITAGVLMTAGDTLVKAVLHDAVLLSETVMVLNLVWFWY